ncbi:S8 family serine peptidase [Smaragdicoccus niigatensis]|uniref:S8 family serine peptidase n=1 Tax=Smaragdicoccus niigatensis TaxID=359359 RepID=UPI000380D69D|nr:S8 family serine peptidase [Smaragdicoccus niigatensis]
MRAWPRAAVAVAVIAGALGFAGAPVATADNSERVIVVFKNGVDADQKTDAFERANLATPVFKYRSAIQGFSATLTPLNKARIAADPDVAFISPDRPVRAYAPTQQILTGDNAPNGVRRIGAATTTLANKASDVGVAVIDTGIGTRTGNLNLGTGKRCVGSSTADDNGHGTHVAGTIAATNNGNRVLGVSPGAKLYPVKVLNSQGSGYWSDIICGIDWVTANAQVLNIKVANMSLGGDGGNATPCGSLVSPSTGDALHDAICRATGKGVTFVVAAGNSGSDFQTQAPAAYPEVLTVTAMSDSNGVGDGQGLPPSCRPSEIDDKVAAFSNYATRSSEINHTVAAPGVCIVSLSTSFWSTTRTLSGTSMASPHVAGSVANCISKGGVPGPCAGMTPAQIITKIRADAGQKTTATPIFGFNGDPIHSPDPNKYYGYLVNGGAY